MNTPTSTYEAEQEDERIRVALILSATENADRLGDVTASQLRAVTDAIIASHGTRDARGACRLCHHDHDPVRRAAADVRDALRNTGERPWKRTALAVLEGALDVALNIEPHSTGGCPCDLAQVGSPDA